MKAIVNTLIIGCILFILYAVAGAGYVDFYFGGKEEILKAADQINKMCHANRECPTTLAGWQGENGTLSKGNMLYIVSEGDKENNQHQAYRLIYRFFAPDEWFEAQGGVDRSVTSGWKSRQEIR